MTSVERNASGSTIERSTCVSAAKFTIESQPESAAVSAVSSAMSPRTKLKRSSASRSAKFSGLPAYVSLS